MNRFFTSTLLSCALLSAQSNAPERVVQANVITSERDPKIQIELPKDARYLGADRWILYDIADCELHLFVEAGGDGKVQRLYWVQFEGYIPSKPELRYKYAFSRTARLAGMDFDLRANVGSSSGTPRQGSDTEHVRALIHAKGYQLPEGVMNVRLVHLLDEQKRKELMIIYSEDAALSGFTHEELLPGGKAHDRWPEVRTEKRIVFRNPAAQPK